MQIPIVHFNDVLDGEPPSTFSNERRGGIDLTPVIAAQRSWAGAPLRTRLHCIQKIRHAIADDPSELVRSLCPSSEMERAEILSAQIIPLAEACRFLEQEAESILTNNHRPQGAVPLWLRDTHAEIRHEPCGIVLIVAPSNYPIFLPGVVLMQALAAGNAVLLKPGPGGGAAVDALLSLLHKAQVPESLVLRLDEDASSVHDAMAAGVDKVVFTGSAATGTKILHACAEHLLPATMELSGCDAMFVRADADVSLAARALHFGLRLNRGATCIAPRRVFIHESRRVEFEAECAQLLGGGQSWIVSSQGDEQSNSGVARLVVEAVAQGARLVTGDIDHLGQVIAPLLVADAKPSMRLLQEDHFSPVAALVSVLDDDEALAANDQCPYALSASVFSRDKRAAQSLAARIEAGSVVINDVIVPTADPRLPFGGRRHSGFGVTRGAEGLLELTVPKVVITRRGTWRPHYAAPRKSDAEFFTQFLSMTHACKWATRLKSALALVRAAHQRRQT
jgi:acyl-CoA reductase-like NAD-dependent aldehyde dehydrogenase